MTTPLPAQKTAANVTYRESGRSDAPARITSAEGLNAEGHAQAARDRFGAVLRALGQTGAA
ncbi:MAG TPA: hypothetical protein VFS80_08605 [Burkholderiales bacterium]|nr:hypothetical protein [Burkholderiales bacterium]